MTTGCPVRPIGPNNSDVVGPFDLIY